MADRERFHLAAGVAATQDGALAALSAELIPVTLVGGAVGTAGLALSSGAWALGGGDPVASGPLVLAAAAAWTWLATAWARFSVERAVQLLAGRVGDPETVAARRGPAEVAAALAATPPLALLMALAVAADLLVLDRSLVGSLLALAAGLLLVVLGLLLPLGACALALGPDLPPLAALAAVLRGAVRGWASLLVVVVAHSLVLGCAGFVLGVVLFACPPLGLLALLWIPVQGAAGSIALVSLALGWSGGEAPETPPPPPAFTARPPAPPGWLLPAAGALARLAYGATLAAGPMTLAARGLALPVGTVAVAAGAIVAPWLAAAALLRHQLARHRRITLDDDGLRVDPGPAWPGRRVPWTRVRGARVREDGVALAVGWSELLVRLPADEVDPLLQWLAARGIRRSDA